MQPDPLGGMRNRSGPLDGSAGGGAGRAGSARGQGCQGREAEQGGGGEWGGGAEAVHAQACHAPRSRGAGPQDMHVDARLALRQQGPV